MLKKTLFLCSIIIMLAIAYYLISPLFRTIEVDQASPLEGSHSNQTDPNQHSQVPEEVKTEEAGNDIVEDSKTSQNTLEELPDLPKVIMQGNFAPQAHEVQGKALLIQDQDSQILRFEDFETVNGPNLHIYLSSSLDASDYIDLGEIKATKGNVNYKLADNIDTTKYDKVLVWCVPFKVLFSYAELK